MNLLENSQIIIFYNFINTNKCYKYDRSTICNSTNVVKALLHDIDNDLECWEVNLASSRVALVFGNMCDGGGAASQL
jgi:hypothetical protein